MPWPWHLTFWPQNLISSSLSRDAPVTKVWRKSVNRYWRYRGNIKLPRESRTHRRTHGRRHGRTTRKHIASAGTYRRRRLKKPGDPVIMPHHVEVINEWGQRTWRHQARKCRRGWREGTADFQQRNRLHAWHVCCGCWTSATAMQDASSAVPHHWHQTNTTSQLHFCHLRYLVSKIGSQRVTTMRQLITKNSNYDLKNDES